MKTLLSLILEPQIKNIYYWAVLFTLKKFDFNASIYYIVWSIGSLFLGYNPPIGKVGPVLSLITIGLIVYQSVQKKPNPIAIANNIYLTYLLLATTVHPWYLITPLFLSVLARDSKTLIWSMVVVLSYSHYHSGGFEEQWPWIIAEYLLATAWFIAPTSWRTKWIQPAT